MKNLPVADACLRNQDPIKQTLEQIFVDSKTILEIGSGTGQHAVYVCKHLTQLIWQPSEMPERVQEVEAWRQHENLNNLLPCVAIDVQQANWQLDTSYDAVFTANTIHYICWQRVEALLKGASEHIKHGGKFVTYGPFNKEQKFTSEGNQNLDAWLKSRDSTSGIKDIEDVSALAKKFGLVFQQEIQMPANNLILEFKKEQ